MITKYAPNEQIYSLETRTTGIADGRQDGDENDNRLDGRLNGPC